MARATRPNNQNFVRLRMLKKYRGLNPGEVGGFQPSEARELIANGTGQALNLAYPPAVGDKDTFPAPPPQAGDPPPDQEPVPPPPGEAAAGEDDDESGESGDRVRGRGRRAQSAAG